VLRLSISDLNSGVGDVGERTETRVSKLSSNGRGYRGGWLGVSAYDWRGRRRRNLIVVCGVADSEAQEPIRKGCLVPIQNTTRLELLTREADMHDALAASQRCASRIPATRIFCRCLVSLGKHRC
jgi:hypothetical protein